MPGPQSGFPAPLLPFAPLRAAAAPVPIAALGNVKGRAREVEWSSGPEGPVEPSGMWKGDLGSLNCFRRSYIMSAQHLGEATGVYEVYPLPVKLSGAGDSV